jgi:hypothetical protein
MNADANVIQTQGPLLFRGRVRIPPGSTTTLVRMASAVEPSTILVTRCDETG